MNIDHMNMITIILIFHNERVAPRSTFRSRLGFRAGIQIKNSRESIRETGNSYHRVASCSSARSLSFTAPSFLSIFVHISGLIDPTILIWVSMERYFPPTELKNFSISGTKPNPRHGRHRRQWDDSFTPAFSVTCNGELF